MWFKGDIDVYQIGKGWTDDGYGPQIVFTHVVTVNLCMYFTGLRDAQRPGKTFLFIFFHFLFF